MSWVMNFKISFDYVSLWAKRLRLTMHFNGFHPSATWASGDQLKRPPRPMRLLNIAICLCLMLWSPNVPSSSGAEVHFFGAGDGFPLPKGDDHGTLRDKLDNVDVMWNSAKTDVQNGRSMLRLSHSQKGYVSTSVNYCISMYTGFWNLKSKWTVMYCTLHTAHN